MATSTESKTTETGQAPSTVFVCINRRLRSDQASCAARNSEAIADALESGINERKIRVRLERSICMGQCTKGPTVRVSPGGGFYLGSSLDDVPHLLDELEQTYGTNTAEEDLPLHLLGS